MSVVEIALTAAQLASAYLQLSEQERRCFLGSVFNSGFTNLSSMPWSDLGCWVYYEDTLPSPLRSEHRPSVPRGGCGP